LVHEHSPHNPVPEGFSVLTRPINIDKRERPIELHGNYISPKKTFSPLDIEDFSGAFFKSQGTIARAAPHIQKVKIPVWEKT